MFNRKAFEEDYAILDGIPKERFDLDRISNSHVVTCGTLACGIGWLMLHPKYTTKGFSISSYGDITYEGKWVSLGNIGAKIYGISEENVWDIFDSRGHKKRTYDPPRWATMPDKKLLLARMRNFLGTQP